LGARGPRRGGLSLRAGDGLTVVVDGEVGAGVPVAGAGLGGGAGEQRAGQRDAVPGELGDIYLELIDEDVEAKRR
jgi:hypothetical protein